LAAAKEERDEGHATDRRHTAMTDRPGEGLGDTVEPEVPPEIAPRLLRALNRSPSTIVTFIDGDLRTRWVSRSATWIAGLDPDSRAGRRSLERVHPEDADRLLHGLAQLEAATPSDGSGRAGGSGVPVMEPVRYRVQRPNGSWQTMEALVHNLLDDPDVNGLVLVGRPVGGELDGVGHVVDLLVADAPFPDVLAACAQLVPSYLGSAAVVAHFDGTTVIGAPPGSPAARLAADDRWWRGTIADGRVRAPVDFAGFSDELADTARAEGFVSAWVSPLSETSTGEVLGCLVVWVRIAVEPNVGTDAGLRQTERLSILVLGEQRRRHALSRQALTDPLTGVANRSALRRRLDAAREPVTVAMLDLDDFKPVNDTHGHDAGDVVLRAVAERLAGSVREEDLVVRLGGDEFVIVFADGTPDDGVAQSVERVIDAIEAPIGLRGDPPVLVQVRVSAGVATGSAAEVVRLADAALYQAKRKKREA
jgi:diguanylate cyclase (GGDEF)-like protein